MKYLQRDFSLDLNELIKATEQSFYEHIELLLSEYTPTFTERNQSINLELKKYGTDPFKPGYFSFVSVEIELEKYKIIIEVPIWKCQRYLLGRSLSKNIPGSKIIGELVTLEEAKNVFREFIEDNLK
ncbi:hypothetical protein JNUCC23_22750 (plasmid) [Peribacillus sp. JNUCC 23]